MAIAAAVIGAICLLAAWLAAPRLAGSDRGFTGTVIACLVVIAGWFYAWQITDLSLRLVPWDDAVFFDRLPLYVAIVLLLAVCRRGIERGSTRTLIAVVVAVFATYSMIEMSAGVWLPLFAAGLSADTDGGVTVMQSTGWSCGAAALAWAARARGLHVSERQMARLAVTAPLRGTKTRGMLRALHTIGLDAAVRRGATWEDLAAAGTPVIAGWKLSRTIGHAVVVLEMSDGQVTVGDPLLGEQTYDRAEFLADWDREMIVIRRRAGEPREL